MRLSASGGVRGRGYSAAMRAGLRTVYRCEWCRCEVTEDLQYIPGTGDRGYCPMCCQTVTVVERREPCTGTPRTDLCGRCGDHRPHAHAADGRYVDAAELAALEQAARQPLGRQ